MTEFLRHISSRKRVILAVWGVNIFLCVVLLAFVLR